MDLDLAKPMDNTLPLGDNCEIPGNRYLNDNARIVAEAARNKVITPLVNNRTPKSFAHSFTKPKRTLPPNTRKAKLNLPPVSSSTWKAFDETAAAALSEPMANINAENFKEKFSYFERALYNLQLEFFGIKKERKSGGKVYNKKEKMLLKLKKIKRNA